MGIRSQAARSRGFGSFLDAYAPADDASEDDSSGLGTQALGEGETNTQQGNFFLEEDAGAGDISNATGGTTTGVGDYEQTTIGDALKGSPSSGGGGGSRTKTSSGGGSSTPIPSGVIAPTAIKPVKSPIVPVKSSSGLSTGAKVGIGFGVLALVGGVVVVAKKRKG